MKIVALEEYFAFPDVFEAWRSADTRAQGPSLASFAQGAIGDRLLDFGTARLAAMDAAGIDVQVLSLTTPGVQGLSASEAGSLAGESNDLLASVVRSRPDRFQGFATLPTPAPHAAARELERAVQELRFQGAMIFGRTGERNADHPDSGRSMKPLQPGSRILVNHASSRSVSEAASVEELLSHATPQALTTRTAMNLQSQS